MARHLDGSGGLCEPCAMLFMERRGSGISFEFIPVVSSKETQETVRPYLDKPLP